MNRKDTTKWLSELLVSKRLTGQGKYYASEVSLDWGTSQVKRVDFLQFCPENVTSASGIEKGKFICYEVKSCVEDVFSGSGLNFIGEQNYLVTTMETWKKLIPIRTTDKMERHITDTNPESSHNYGVIVPVPCTKTLEQEFESPTPIGTNCDWDMAVVLPCRSGPRNRSMTQLLFYMIRAGK